MRTFKMDNQISGMLLIMSLCLLVIPAKSQSKFYHTKTFKDKYVDHLDKGEKVIYSGYHFVCTKTADGEYVKRTFYPEKNILTRKEQFKDQKFMRKEGFHKEWWDNGQLKSEGYIENKTRNGEWKNYNAYTGNVSSQGSYENGVLVGTWKHFDSKGRLRNEIEYDGDGEDDIYIKYDTLGNFESKEVGPAHTFKKTTTDDENRTDVEELPFLISCVDEKDVKERQQCSQEALLKFIYSSLRYPADARENGVEGTALFSFVVDKDGHVQDVTVKSGVCASIEAECERILKDIPQWSPGKQKGEPVRVLFHLPLKFKLE